MASSLLKALASGRRASSGLLEQAQRGAVIAGQNGVSLGGLAVIAGQNGVSPGGRGLHSRTEWGKS